MSLDLLARHYRNLFQSVQWQKQEPEEPKMVIPPRINFLTPDKVFNDILPQLSNNKFYALSLLGPQGTGKTITASVFATYAERSGFRVVYAMPEDFMKDMASWIERVKENPADKYCFVLEDLSYSMDTQSRKSQSIIKNFISRIRHIFSTETKPSQIFVIYITHRLHAVPPMLRNSGSWIFTSMQAADREDAMKLIARRKEMRERLDQIYTFIARATIEGPRDGKFVYQIGDQDVSFRWGNEESPGDGRLMASFHSGDMKIFNSQIIPDMINLKKYRIASTEHLVIEPEEPTEIMLRKE